MPRKTWGGDVRHANKCLHVLVGEAKPADHILALLARVRAPVNCEFFLKGHNESMTPPSLREYILSKIT